ncbi:MAG: iron-containing alcohol dehydrogenase [Deltaproteobacteria bacterium]|nr:iron-containing alcohol dehydrogenase [Deltaproteobacteria bacterium]
MADSPPISGNFNYPTTYRIGAGRVVELAASCRELGIERPLVVTDPGVAALPFFAAILERLAAAGLAAKVFSAIDPNPAVAHVEAGVAEAKAHAADGCVLIGGGSALDVGKCIALLVRNPGGVLDYEDRGENWKRADGARILPVIAIPTTAGTGSEVGRAAVILDPSDHAKKIVFHPRLQPRLVLADPELTLGLPPRLTAATGLDAFAHCFEAYCAPAYHPMADGIALEGMRLIAANLPRAFEHGGDVAARTHLLMAAAMGATAFQKGLGLIHALSHPVGGVTGLHHGTANAIFQPYVMVHNREAIEARMPRLAQALELEATGGTRTAGLGGVRGPSGRSSDRNAFDAVLEWFLALRRRLGLPESLEGLLAPEQIPALVPMVLADPSLETNPKTCSAAEIERVLCKSIAGDLIP